MNLISSIEEALRRVDAFQGRPEDFALPIPETLIDPIGLNVAIITDRILAKGWEPNGFKQRPGFRLYLYK